jgi:hypothetical protein
MAELFPGPGVRITHDTVETLTGVRRCYPVAELERPHVVHESAIDVLLASPTARVCSSTLSGLSVLVAVAGSELMSSPHATVGGVLLALAAAIAAVHGWRTWRRPRALWAYYRGTRVCLFVSRDRLEFAQVVRALLRALEAVETVEN